MTSWINQIFSGLSEHESPLSGSPHSQGDWSSLPSLDGIPLETLTLVLDYVYSPVKPASFLEVVGRSVSPLGASPAVSADVQALESGPFF